MAGLPLLPAAAASLAYLNARHGISYDWPIITSFIRASVNAKLAERRDNLNLFYDLEARAQSSRANHPWIIFQGRSWTYAQAYDIALRYGAWFTSKGVQKDEIIAMDFVNSETFIWVWYGLWSIGAKPAFINYNLTGKPLAHTVKTSTAGLVLVDEEGRHNFDGQALEEHGFVALGGQKYEFEMDASDIPKSVRKQAKASEHSNESTSSTRVKRQLEVVYFDKALEAEILAFPPNRLPDASREGQKPHHMAILIYTSGTTGLPKPAVVSWAKCNIAAKFIGHWMGIENDIMYTSMPLYHSSASILGVCATLRAGSTLSLSKKFSHKTIWPEIRESGATILHYVGETCRYLLSAPPSELDKAHKLRAAFGNGLRPDVWEPFKQRFGIQTIYEFYSATEAPSGLWNWSANTFSTGAIGRNGTLTQLLFAPGTAVVRLDPNTDSAEPSRDPQTGLCQVCDWNEPGELLYRLDPDDIAQKFQGYFGNAKATNSKIIRNVKKKGDAWFRSGDLVRWDKEGRWWFLDRIGDTFRWKAENVSTAEVSEAVGKHPAIEEANVYGVQVPRHDGRAGCAAVILKPSAVTASSDSKVPVPTPESLRSLAEHVRKELPAFAQPLWLRFTKEMQLTGTNKQQKHLLQKDGIDPVAAEAAGDSLYWLKDGLYVPFTSADLEKIEGGGVKL